jgi:hypothetical protein
MAKENVIRLVISITALLIAVIHLNFPSHMDLIMIGLLVVAIVPWLSPVVKSIEVAGWGKLEFQELSRRVEAAEGAAESAGKKAELAISPISPALISEREILVETENSRAELEAQVAEYNKIRDTMEAGSARTTAMTGVVRKMIDLAAELSDLEVKEWLPSENRGQRLAAYARLYGVPNFILLGPLVESVTKIEDKPFGQYWGLQAVTRVLAAYRVPKISRTIIRSLREFGSTLQPGTDRDYELKRILQSLASRVDETD